MNGLNENGCPYQAATRCFAHPSSWRQQVTQLPSARNLDTPTLNDHIPQLLDELADALNSASLQTIAETLAEGSPPVHGLERFREGYDIESVVMEYNILRGCIHDLAQNNGLSLEGESFRIVNGVLTAQSDWQCKPMPPSEHSSYRSAGKNISPSWRTIFVRPLNAVAVAQAFVRKRSGTETLERIQMDAEDLASQFATTPGAG